MTPRTVTAAKESGYILKSIYAKDSAKVRIDMQPRFYKQGMKAVVSFWVSRKYAEKIYPSHF